jgi:riboflavin kinase/FMN adenylyltransferase
MNKIVLALGYFDALHKGHRVVLGAAYNLAKKLDATLVVTTFSNNFSNDKLIYTADEREYFIKEMGLKFLILDNSPNFFKTTAEDFLAMILNPESGVVAVVAGEDYRFGLGAKGDVNLIKQHAKNAGILAEIVPLYHQNGQKVSTTAIKELISQGEIEGANDLLYRPYTIVGKVVHGKGVGAKKTYPTANVQVSPKKLLPPAGVYITETIDIINRVIYPSVTNIGAQPTFDAQKPQIETFLLNFEGDLYESYIEINFLKKIRDIVKFNSAEELKAQIDKDVETAKAFLQVTSNK